jgi:2-phospho-L-lactate guanylyltransferase (CobY/MobA/RfbA family)
LAEDLTDHDINRSGDEQRRLLLDILLGDEADAARPAHDTAFDDDDDDNDATTALDERSTTLVAPRVAITTADGAAVRREEISRALHAQRHLPGE